MDGPPLGFNSVYVLRSHFLATKAKSFNDSMTAVVLLTGICMIHQKHIDTTHNRGGSGPRTVCPVLGPDRLHPVADRDRHQESRLLPALAVGCCCRLLLWYLPALAGCCCRLLLWYLPALAGCCCRLLLWYLPALAGCCCCCYCGTYLLWLVAAVGC